MLAARRGRRRRGAGAASPTLASRTGRSGSRCSARAIAVGQARAARGSRATAASAWIARGLVAVLAAVGATVAIVACATGTLDDDRRALARYGHLLVLAVLGVALGAAQRDATRAARPRASCCSSRRRCSITRGRSRCRGRIATCSRCCSARSSSITTSRSGSSAAEDPRARKALVIVSACARTSASCSFFKYTDFFTQDVLHLPVQPLHLILPAGISFHTFQSLSYTIDVYRRQLRGDALGRPVRDVRAVLPAAGRRPDRARAGSAAAARPTCRRSSSRRRRAGCSGSSSGCSRRSRSPTRSRSRSSIACSRRRSTSRRSRCSPACTATRCRSTSTSRRTPTSRSARREVLGLRAARELPHAVSQREPPGVLAALAHLAVDVAARLPLHHARRQPRRRRGGRT